jgi:hypothetical protein
LLSSINLSDIQIKRLTENEKKKEVVDTPEDKNTNEEIDPELDNTEVILSKSYRTY